MGISTLISLFTKSTEKTYTTVFSDTTAIYAIALIYKDFVASYTIQGPVSNDIICEYDVEGPPVPFDVLSDLEVIYNIPLFVLAPLEGVYDVKTTDTMDRNLTVIYNISKLASKTVTVSIEVNLTEEDD